MKQELFNILSPDGFTISTDNFKTKEEALNYFAEWKKRFELQGYYSSNNGRISLEDLDDECCFINL